jgi:hypothetical protein
MREHGPVVPLEQRCIEPGHWLIEGRRVKAIYQGRSRNVLGWNVQTLEGDEDPGPSPFGTLAAAREWIRNQGQETGS